MAKDLEEVAGEYIGLSDNVNKKNGIYRPAILCVFLIAVVGLCGKTIFNKPNDGEKSEERPAAAEYVISRGRIEGVSEKSVGASISPYPWTNAELSWQRTGFHFQPEKNWMNGTVFEEI